MPWIQITLHTTAQHVEPVSDALMAIGALSVTCGDDADEPLYEPALNTTPVWQQTHVVGLFEEDTDRDLLPVALQAALSPIELPSYEITVVEDQEWTRVWMDEFHPMQFGQGLWVCPSWQEPPEPEAINILLDPGLAFGTGTHATTALCLEWLAQQGNLSGQTWIDYGCGSGILAIAAVKLGATQVWGVDNDPQALLATQDNSEKNHIPNQISTCLPEDFPKVLADGMLANILAAPLVSLAPVLAQHVRPEGWIVLSGILQEQAQMVADAYAPFFQMDAPTVQEDWVRLVGRRLSTAD